MAQDAELLLKVGLDLSHFRGQLNRLGADLAGQALNLSVKFNRASISSELNLLQRQLGNKVFRVEVNTNLKIETERAEKLANRLKDLQGLKITAPVTGVASVAKREANKIRSEIRRAVLREGGKITVPVTAEVKQKSSGGKFTQRSLAGLGLESLQGLYKGLADAGLASFDESIINNKAKLAKRIFSIGKDVVAGFLNGIESDDPKVKASAEALGKNFLNTLKTGLGIASPSKETAKLGKFATQGFVLGFISELVRSERKIANAITRSAVGFIYEGLAAIGDLGPAFAPLERQLKAGALRAIRRAFKDGFKGSLVPGIQGALLGLLGGGATGGLIGGTTGAAGAISGGLATLGAGGRFEIAKQLGRLTIGDTSGLTAFVQDLTAQAMEQAFSTGTLGALIGGAAIAGVAGTSGFIKGSIGSLSRQIVEGIANKIISDVGTIASGELGPIIQASLKRIVSAFMHGMERRVASMDISFPPMMKALPPAYRGLPPAPGPAGFLPPAYRGLPPARDAKMLSAAAAPAGLLTAISQTTARRASVEALIKGLPSSEEPPGKLFPLERMLQMLRERLEQMLSIETIRISEDVAADLKKGLYGFSMIANALNEAEAAAKRARIEAKVSQLVDSLEKAIDTANARALMGIREAQVRLVSPAALPGALPRLALPPAGETIGSKRMGGGYVPPGGFPTEGILAPSREYRPAQTELGAGYFAAGKAINAFGNAYGKVRGFLSQNKLPLGGAIAEVGQEFGTALKQVLLYGTAYKALAFFTDLPNQAFEAAKGLATYQNQLKAVTSTTGTFEQSMAFVDGMAQRFNVPLESARQGFVKLYASMQPAGFSQEQIENLFTGISKATAAFGLSADKVDRVNYAFAQMASKGQIMSEELKGQLGDVLPGALALFAEAAQMSIPEFSKAMEDGAFKGKAMEQVLGNVGILMNSKFGPAAQGAAKTLQGALTQIQNNLKLMYESLTPIVNAFAATFGPVVNSLIRDFTSTMKVLTGTFIDGEQAIGTLSPRALFFYNTIQQLRPALQSAAIGLTEIGSRLASLAPLFINAIDLTLRFIGSPLGRAALLASVAIATLNGALNLLKAVGLTGALKQVYLFIGGLLKIPAATGLARIGIIALKAAVTGIVVGAVLMGLDLLIGKLLGIGDAANNARKDVKNLAQELDLIAGAGDVIAAAKEYADANTRLIQARRANEKALDDLENARNKRRADPFEIAGAQAAAQKAYDNLIEAEKGLQMAKKTRETTARKELQNQLETANKLQKIDLQAGKDNSKTAAKAAEDARKLADDKRKYEADLMKLNAQQAIELDSMYFEQWKTLQEKKFDYMETGQNDWMKREVQFQRNLQAIETRRIEAIRKAQLDTQKAVVEAQGAAYVAGGASGVTGLMQGSTGISSGPHFDVRRTDRKPITEAEARALFDVSISRQLRMTSGYGPRNTGIPGASTFHHGIDLAGPANTPLNLAPGYTLQGAGMQGGLGYAANVQGPQGQMYQVGHLQQPQAGVPASRLRTEAKQDYSAELTAQEAINAKQREALAILHASQQAQQEINVLIKEYVASIAPVEQQKLENSLLRDRIDLIKTGLTGEALDAEVAISKARRESALGIETAQKAIDSYQEKIQEINQALKDKKITAEEAVRATDNYRNSIAISEQKIRDLTAATQEYLPLLREQLSLAQQAAEAELRGAIQRATPLGGAGLAGGFIGDAAAKFEEALGRGASREDATRFAELQNQLTLLETRNEAIKSSVLAIGDAFGTAMTTGVASLVEGTASAEEVFANFLRSVGQALLQAAQQMIATYIAIGIARIFAGLGSASTTGATGPNPGGIPSTGNVTAPSVNGFDLGSLANVAANGAVWKGGFQAFADGGMVTGPTLGLIGEGKYNEAIVPLPDGRSIPVQLQDSSIRDKMGGDGSGMMAMPMLSMSFQSTTINGVEYVDRAQLEAAMAETRRISVREGATRGATIALDKLANSPSSRRRVGLR